MRWQIEQFVFCDQQQTLTYEDQVQQLEPIVVELLSYLCQHPDVIVSREELINSVWLGRVVSDSAVNKVVTKLRRHFDDDVRIPRFIATFPKKGYKFIAIARPIDSAERDADDSPVIDTNLQQEECELQVNEKTSGSSISNSKPDYLILVSLGILLIVSVFVFAKFIHQRYFASSPSQIRSTPLTRDAGADIFPNLSPDGTMLSYVEVIDNKMILKVRNLTDESISVIDHGAAKSISAGPADWSDDGTQIVYLVTSPQSCEYFIRDLQGKTFSSPRLIHSCPVGSYGKIEFTHDKRRLVYAESEGPNSPYSLFELNLQSGQIRRLLQPELVVGGNNQFDLHPKQNKLLISSPDKRQWEVFYELNLDSDELKQLFKLNTYVCCGIWSHDGERIILISDNPSNQILSFGKTGMNPITIYAGNLSLSRPTRHSNGKDYLFSAGESNLDIHFLKLGEQISQELITNSVDDRLATYSEASSTLAYISVATGHEEIWLSQGSSKRLTHFNDGRHYIDLIWRPDGKQILALSLNELHLVDATSGETTKVDLPQREIRAVSFKDNQTIAFSANINDKWGIVYYDLNTHTTSHEKSEWQYVKFSEDQADTIWIDQLGDLYTGTVPQKNSGLDKRKVDFLFGRTFNIQKQGSTWYWQQRANNRFQLNQKKQNQAPESLLLTDSAHFSLSKEGIYFHRSPPLNLDIYRTVTNQ